MYDSRKKGLKKFCFQTVSKQMSAWKSSPQSNSNASDGTQIWVHSRYHWTNFWFRSLRSLFGWGHLLFAYLVWTYDSQMLVILRFCIFSCIFESWQTRCQLQNSHKVEIDREIAPPPNAYFGDLHFRKTFLPTARNLNQVNRSCQNSKNCLKKFKPI